MWPQHTAPLPAPQSSARCAASCLQILTACTKMLPHAYRDEGLLRALALAAAHRHDATAAVAPRTAAFPHHCKGKAAALDAAAPFQTLLLPAPTAAADCGTSAPGAALPPLAAPRWWWASSAWRLGASSRSACPATDAPSRGAGGTPCWTTWAPCWCRRSPCPRLCPRCGGEGVRG